MTGSTGTGTPRTAARRGAAGPTRAPRAGRAPRRTDGDPPRCPSRPIGGAAPTAPPPHGDDWQRRSGRHAPRGADCRGTRRSAAGARDGAEGGGRDCAGHRYCARHGLNMIVCPQSVEHPRGSRCQRLSGQVGPAPPPPEPVPEHQVWPCLLPPALSGCDTSKPGHSRRPPAVRGAGRAALPM